MESEKMKKIKLFLCAIKDVACALWDEYTPMPRKEIKAKELEEICEMFSPSFSRFIGHLQKRGMTIDKEDKWYLFEVFYMTFDSSFPKEVRGENLDNLIKETRRVLEKLNRFGDGVITDYSFLDSMVLDTETILARIKDKGLEKHVVFYEHRSSSSLMETFWGAFKKFLAERLDGSPNNKYSEDARVPEYMSKWSFIFNRKVVPASSSIEIKNLKVIGSPRINFERFTCVVFSRNVFCGPVKIQAMRHKRDSDKKNGFIFCKNIFCRYVIHFRHIHYFVLDRNNFNQSVSLFHFPSIPSNPNRRYNDIHPIMRLIRNEMKKQLAIESRRVASMGGPVPIKIEFLRRNRLTGLRIRTHDNELGGETMVKVKSDINNISFDVQEKIKPADIDLNLLGQYKNFFLELKNLAIRKKDRSAEFNYARKERYFDGRLSSRWEDKLVFGWSEIVSDSGISWVRPLGFLLFFQAIFIGLPVWCMTKNYELGIMLAIETFNPLTTLSAGVPEDLLMKHPYLIPALTVFQKIYLSILLYEIIKVLRRFSK